MKYSSKGPEDTQEIAQKLLNSLTPGGEATVVALIGDLGGGKTTFSQYIGKELGVEDEMQSPTFLIQKIYELEGKPWKHLVHIDAYRLDKPDELLTLGWNDLIADPGNLILVEWADKFPNILPEGAKKITFTHVSENSRDIEFDA